MSDLFNCPHCGHQNIILDDEAYYEKCLFCQKPLKKRPLPKQTETEESMTTGVNINDLDRDTRKKVEAQLIIEPAVDVELTRAQKIGIAKEATSRGTGAVAREFGIPVKKIAMWIARYSNYDAGLRAMIDKKLKKVCSAQADEDVCKGCVVALQYAAYRQAVIDMGSGRVAK